MHHRHCKASVQHLRCRSVKLPRRGSFGHKWWVGCWMEMELTPVGGEDVLAKLVGDAGHLCGIRAALEAAPVSFVVKMGCLDRKGGVSPTS